MKFIVALSACILLTIVAESAALPKPQVSSAQKPGSCYRPGFGRKRREVENIVTEDNDAPHLIEKRQIQGSNGNGGSQGSNPWRPPATPPPSSKCRNDYSCPNNKKCCSGVCQTPSFVG